MLCGLDASLSFCHFCQKPGVPEVMSFLSARLPVLRLLKTGEGLNSHTAAAGATDRMRTVSSRLCSASTQEAASGLRSPPWGQYLGGAARA